jgi:hypothetical protein
MAKTPRRDQWRKVRQGAHTGLSKSGAGNAADANLNGATRSRTAGSIPPSLHAAFVSLLMHME